MKPAHPRQPRALPALMAWLAALAAVTEVPGEPTLRSGGLGASGSDIPSDIPQPPPMANLARQPLSQPRRALGAERC